MVNANDSHPVTTGDQEVETVDSFTYLGAVIGVDKGKTAVISCRLRKARAAFCKLKKVWASNQYTRIRIYKSKVMAVLLYGSEYWKVDKSDGQRLNVFHNRCLQRIFSCGG